MDGILDKINGSHGTVGCDDGLEIEDIYLFGRERTQLILYGHIEALCFWFVANDA